MVAARTSTIPWRGIIKSSTDDLGPPLCQVDEEESCPALWARQQSSPDPGTESEDYRSPSDKKKQAINQWSWQRHDRKRQTLPYYAWTTYSSSSYYCTIDKDRERERIDREKSQANHKQCLIIILQWHWLLYSTVGALEAIEGWVIQVLRTWI